MKFSIDEESVWLLLMMGVAIMGRIMAHAELVINGKRKFWSVALFMETIIAIAMFFLARAICAWFGIDLHSDVSLGFVVAISYIGPRAISQMWDMFVKFWANKNASDD